MEKKPKKLTIIMLVIILVLLFYLIFIKFFTKPPVIKDNNHIRALNNKVDSLNKANQILIEEMVKNEEDFKRIEKLVKNNVKNITIIKENTYEKINVVDGFNVNQLSDFFTKRYQDTTGFRGNN